jgi:hypothetical protein
MRKLWPFFCYYGGKWRAAPHYPAPQYQTVIEPFAGAAGYATRYHSRSIVLADANPLITNLWRYLIKVSAQEVRALPLVVEHVDDLAVCQEAKHLIGFWLNKATSGSPRKRPASWMRSGVRPNSYWGEAVRDRIASQVDFIRHWRVVDGDYSNTPAIEGTWFVDPPYANAAGAMYLHKVTDYERLAEWCRARRGQLIVCENSGATWLPFADMGSFKSNPGSRGKGKSREAIYAPRFAELDV